MNVFFPEWRNVNGLRKYPFADTATLTATTGEQWQVGTLLDARIFTIGAALPLRLTSLIVAGTKVTFILGDENTAELATGSYDIAVDYDGLVKLLDSNQRPAGTLVLAADRAAGLLGWGQGPFTFGHDALPFAVAAVTALPDSGVTALVPAGSTALAGEVWVVGGNGVVVRQQSGAVRVDVVGSPYYARAKCQALGQTYYAPPCLKSINHLFPGKTGNFGILPGLQNPDNILRVTPETNGVRISLAGSSNAP